MYSNVEVSFHGTVPLKKTFSKKNCLIIIIPTYLYNYIFLKLKFFLNISIFIDSMVLQAPHSPFQMIIIQTKSKKSQNGHRALF